MTNVFYGPDDSVIKTYTETYAMTTNVGGAKNYQDRWNYIGNIFPATEIAGSTYMVMTTKCVPTAFHAGQYFDIDRCVFREQNVLYGHINNLSISNRMYLSRS